MNPLLGLFVLLALIAGSVVISLSEIAFAAAREVRIRALAEAGNKKARRFVALRADAPVLGSPAVLADAGMPARTGEEDAGQERAVEDFRDFLDTVRPEDFA